MSCVVLTKRREKVVLGEGFKFTYNLSRTLVKGESANFQMRVVSGGDIILAENPKRGQNKKGVLPKTYSWETGKILVCLQNQCFFDGCLFIWEGLKRSK
jgi:hypothetical protein